MTAMIMTRRNMLLDASVAAFAAGISHPFRARAATAPYPLLSQGRLRCASVALKESVRSSVYG